MAIAQKVAGYSLGAGRPAAPRDGQEEEVRAGRAVRGRSPPAWRERVTPTAAIKTLWDILLPFSDYAFNKAHSAAYGLVSYWTAYLKANYPAEYMAALLTSVKDDKDKMAIYLAECRRMGIKVLPPDVNASDANFTPIGTDIRFGLTAVRNVGANVVASIVATRKAKGEFADFDDFLRKVDAVVCNKRTIEALIKGGAFDSLGHARRGLMQRLRAGRRRGARHQARRGDRAVRPVRLVRRRGRRPGRRRVRGARARRRVGQEGAAAVRARDARALRLRPPAVRARARARPAAADDSIADRAWPRRSDEPQTVTLAGILSAVNRRVTKAGAPWANAVLEDLEGSIEVMFFPATYAQVALDDRRGRRSSSIKGRTDARDDTVKLIASRHLDAEHRRRRRRAGRWWSRCAPTRCTPPMVDRLKDVLATHPGTTEVHLQLVKARTRPVLRLGDGYRVNAVRGADGRPEGPARPARRDLGLRPPIRRTRCARAVTGGSGRALVGRADTPGSRPGHGGREQASQPEPR